ncbi:hypothetical protein McPS_32440 [Marichromatium sp. PS1]|uniref:hypothetical protein n=1 Tax=Marichromatium sp. PS1 TaxID=3138932 RepID=UPI0032E77137
MQLRFFTIPIHGGEATVEALNRFLAAQRILSVERHLIEDGGASAWALCIAYEPAGEGARPPTTRRGKVDDCGVLREPRRRPRLTRCRNPMTPGVLVAGAVARRRLAGGSTRSRSSTLKGAVEPQRAP